jgi:hypothetical protein
VFVLKYTITARSLVGLLLQLGQGHPSSIPEVKPWATNLPPMKAGVIRPYFYRTEQGAWLACRSDWGQGHPGSIPEVEPWATNLPPMKAGVIRPYFYRTEQGARLACRSDWGRGHPGSIP